MRIFGLPVIGILVAAIVVFVIGFVWYGLLFDQQWMQAYDLTEADFEGNSPWWMAGGFVISIAIAKAMAFVVRWNNWPDMGRAVYMAGMLGLVLGGAIAAYGYVWTPDHNLTLFLIDWGHMIITWAAAAAVLTLLKKV